MSSFTSSSSVRRSPLNPKLSKMRSSTALVTLGILFIVALSLAAVSANPIQRQKRQSDQRIAELETLLALQKYGQHRLRDWGRAREMSPPGYGLIDFDKIGRRKKSTRFSPGAEEDKVWNSWLSQSLESRALSNSEAAAQVDQN